LVSLKRKYVVLVDDCVETGLTMMVALKSAIEREAKNIYIATPILDTCVYQNLLTVCDGVFCPHKIEDYISIEYYYKDFKVLDVEQISEIISTHKIKNKKQETEIKKGQS
jgi:putative phosphoribosyl transferase